jgi:hypothetical protein
MSATSGKVMRVATLFTGTAVLTLGGAAAAHAQTARPAIEEATDCGQGGYDFEWLHIANHARTNSYCFGYSGTTNPTYEVGIAAECGGTNFGFLAGKSWPDGFNFHPGSTYNSKVNHAHLSTVEIFSWSGTYGCSAY